MDILPGYGKSHQQRPGIDLEPSTSSKTTLRPLPVLFASEVCQDPGRGQCLAKDTRVQSKPLPVRMCEHAQSLSHVRFFATPWTVAPWASLSMGFPR